MSDKNKSVTILTNEEGDRYVVKLVRDGERFLSEEVNNLLAENHLSLWGIYLEREGYEQPVTGLRTLFDISKSIKKFLLDNKGGMVYYVCDDMMDVPMNDRHKQDGVQVQRYRNQLFSILFEKVSRDAEEPFSDTPIYIDACGNTIYIHVLARQCHQHFVDIIRQDIRVGFSKPED